jgi:hypothetical protein
MLNPTFYQVNKQDGHMRLQKARLNRVDARTLEDIGLTDTEWSQPTGDGRARVAAFLGKVRHLFVRRRPHAATTAIVFPTTKGRDSSPGPKFQTHRR